MAIWVVKKEKVEEVGVVLGLILMQIMVAGNTMAMSYAMKLGINPLMLSSSIAFFTFLLLLPFSILLERSRWPERLYLRLLIKFFVIAFIGVTMIQLLFLKGVERTSPAIATALPNLCPGLTFLFAWGLGLEKVKLSCFYSRAKLLGTVLCVAGAVVLSLMHSAAKRLGPGLIFDMEQIIGCLYLLAATFTGSCNVILQTKTLKQFSAPISLATVSSFIGIFLTIIVQLVHDRKFQIGLPSITIHDLLICSLPGGIVSGTISTLIGWALRRKGPVFVSMFNPIATVISVTISTISLSEPISIGSLVGMSLIFSGLYLVLWAKAKEALPVDPSIQLKTPLLS